MATNIFLSAGQSPSTNIAVIDPSNPPFGILNRKYNTEVLNAWEPSAVVSISTKQLFTAVQVDSPPLGNAPALSSELIELVAWQPDLSAHQFFGGRGPFMPAPLSSSVIAVAVSNPPVKTQTSRPWVGEWVPSELSPQLQVKLAQGPPAWVPFGTSIPQGTISNFGSYDSLVPSVYRGIPAPALLAGQVDNPPFGIPAVSQRSILDAWQPPAAPAPVAGSLNPAISTVVVNNPPFGVPPRSAATIRTSWAQPDAQAPTGQALNPVFSAVQVNSSPYRRITYNIVLWSWIVTDPLPILSLKVPQVQTAAVVPVINITSYEIIAAAWVTADTVLQSAAHVPQSVVAAPVSNPPISSSANDQLAGGGIWPSLPDPLPILSRYLPAFVTDVQVNNPPPRFANQLVIARAWTESDLLPLHPRNRRLLSARVVPPNNSSIWTVLSAWYPDNIRVISRAKVIAAAKVDNPPASSTANDQLLAVGAWSALPDPLPTLPGPASVLSAPVNDPPFGGSLGTSVFAYRAGETSSVTWTQLPPEILSEVQVSNPLGNSGYQDAIASWASEAATTITWVQLPPEILAVPAQGNNPAFGGSPLQGVFASFVGETSTIAWVQAPASLLDVPVNNPAGRRPDRLSSILVAWAPLDPMPIVAGLLNPDFDSIVVDNPPVQGPVAAAVVSGILTAWVPPEAQAPTGGLLNPALESVFVNNPTGRRPDRFTSIVSTWVPPDPAPIVAGLLNPDIEAIAVTNAPGRRPDRLASIIGSWVPPDPAPVVAGLLNQTLEAVSVNNPPGSGAATSTPALIDILAAWGPVDIARQSLPRLRPQIAPSFIPPYSTALKGIVASWAPSDAQVQLPRIRNPLFGAPVVNNPPIKVGAAARDSVLARWVLADPNPVQKRLVPQGPVIAFGASSNSSSATITTAWTPELVALPPLRRLRILDAPVAHPVGVSAQILEVITGAWAPDITVVQALVLQVPATAFIGTPKVNLETILGAWIPPVLPPIMSALLSAAALDIPVNPPPVLGGYLDNLSMVITAWTPSVFDPWFTSTSTGQTFIPPRPPIPHGSSIYEAIGAPGELGSSLRAGIGRISTS